MSDIGRFLPLSQNRGANESDVTGDWTSQSAECLDAIIVMLRDLTPEQWNCLVGPEQWPVAAVIGNLVDRISAALGSPVADAVRTVVKNDLTGISAVDSPVQLTPQGAAAMVQSLRQVADKLREEPGEASRRIRWTGRAKIRRESLRVLTDIVVTGYDVADAVESEVLFPPVATGAVALARVGRAPGAIRAVVRGRTVTATDAQWSFGRGPEFAGSASAIIRFLFGRAGVPR